ncbi:MAG: hypothetical protein WB716_10845 [Candidatus Acidiferrales bacterium]
MGHFVDVDDIGAGFLLLLTLRDRLGESDNTASCLNQIEQLAVISPYEGVRASANEILRLHRERVTKNNSLAGIDPAETEQ